MLPTYTFEVIAYNLHDIMNNPLATDLEALMLSLNNRTVFLQTMSGSFKHGDQFTVSGNQAIYLKKLYVDDPERAILKIV